MHNPLSRRERKAMRKTFYLKHKSFFEKFNGILLGNPVLERGLILAPVVVASYNFQNSLILGIAFAIITFFAVVASSFVSKKIPYTVRTIIYTMIACVIFIPTAMLLELWFKESLMKLGVFVPLLVANSLIVVKSETRFHKHSKGTMIFDLICHMIGFFMVIVTVGTIREFLGEGKLFGQQIEGMTSAPAVQLPFGGFIVVGFLAALVKSLKHKLEHPRDKRKREYTEI